MKRTTFLTTAILLPLLVAVAHSQEPPSYEKQIQPFFAKYCSECHNAKKPRAGLNLETYKGLQAGSDNGSVVVPGDPDKSLLVLLTEKRKEPSMPPKEAKQPEPAEIALLRAWVKAGAKGSDAAVKVVLPAIQSKVKAHPPLTALVWHPDGRLIAGAGKDLHAIGSPHFHYLTTTNPAPDNITALALSKDGRQLAVACGTPGAPGMLLLYDVPAQDELWRVPRKIENAHDDVIQKMAFSPDGRTLITCGYDRLVKMWDVPAGKERKTLKEHSDAVYGVAFAPDGRLFATCAADRAVKVWAADTGKLLYTLSEATDWLYALAWSPDGKHLTAGGVDKSIRVWKVDAGEGRIVHSVFAHQAPVLQLAYAPDGKTLYSISEDRTLKAWDAAKMVETKVFAAQSDTPLSLAVHPGGKLLALGRFDGELLLIEPQSGKVRQELKSLRQQTRPGASRSENAAPKDAEPNDSPGTGQPVKLPAIVQGVIGKAGDLDYFRFEAKAGQPFGVQVTPAGKGKPALEPYLELTDGSGNVLASSRQGHLGFTFAKSGTYALGVRDRQFNGGPQMTYTLKLGPVPVVTAVYPLGLQRGTEADIQVEGVNLGNVKAVRIKADANAAPGTKLPVAITTPAGAPLGSRAVIVGEFPEVIERGPEPEAVSKGASRKSVRSAADLPSRIPVPGTANGRISIEGETDTWKFAAKKGQRLILEVNARRLGSSLDSYIEILDAKGQPVPRATLRSLAKTYVTFREHNSVQPNIRIEAWSELAVNDYIWVGSELLRIRSLPTHPDADCIFFSTRGQRTGFLDTTPTHLAKDEPMYKVAIHPPGMTFPPNGFPVVTVFYRNDDGPPGFGRDSRLVFDPPADSDYLVRIGDTRGRGGPNFAYRLTVRPPRPSYNVTFAPTEPAVGKGEALPITVTAERIDEFDGPIDVRLDNLPPGFSAPATTIPAGEESTTFALFAEPHAKDPPKGTNLKLVAQATIDGQIVRREVAGGVPKAIPTGDIVTTAERSEITLTPGGETKLTVHIERRNKFAGRVPLDVLGMPHGVKVLDLGLNGILITEKETSRTITFYCHPWVRPIEHPIVIVARQEGRNTQHAARSVLLRVVAP